MAANPKKRPRERNTADSELFAIYEDLASENEQIRFKAAVALIKRIQSADAHTIAPILRRLIKGVCSSRKGARLGFSAALTELLNQHVVHADTFTVQFVLELLQELTEPPGDAAGQEARDHFIGRVFVAQCLALSGALDAATVGQDGTNWLQFLDVVLNLAKKKPWLREQCAWVLRRALPRADPKIQARDSRILVQSLVDHGLEKTPEGVALWSRVRLDFTPSSWPVGAFANNDPLASSNRSLLVRIMKEDVSKSDDESTQVQAQRGSWSAAPNFAWNEIFSCILGSDYASNFGQFWRELVDGGIFGATSSPERKLSGFALFASTITTLPTDLAHVLFTRNIMVNLNQQLFTKQGYLHESAVQAVNAVLDRAQSDPEIVPNIITHLFADQALMRLILNANLRVKFLEKLISRTDSDNADKVIDAMSKPLRSQKLQTLEQQSMIESLVILVVTRIKSLPYPNSQEPKLATVRERYVGLLKLLAESAYFAGESDAGEKATTGKVAAPIPDREFFRTQLNNALANLLIKDSDPSYYYLQTAKLLHDLQKSHSGLAVLDEQVQEQVDKARKCAAKLEKKRKEDRPHLKALSLLLSMCVIQVYNGDADALEALDDLQECYTGMTASEDDEEQAKAAEAIVEIILSFTSKPPTLFKNMAQRAFTLCTDIVTSEGIQSMVEVLKTKEDISGQNEMFDERDEDEAEEDEDVDGADDSDVEMIDAGSEADADEQESSGDDSDVEADGSENEQSADDDAVDVEDADDEELIAFDAKLAQALGTRRADDDMAHDEEESEESDMDDEQMEALDEHITNMFKQRKQAANKSKKKEAKEARENMVVFKTRVLELLKIYINKEHASPLALHLVVPLVRLVKETRNTKIRSEALELLNRYFQRVKLRKKDGEVVDKAVKKEAKKLLGEVHELLGAKKTKPLQSACSKASLLLVKAFLANGGNADFVEKQYEKTRERVKGRDGRYTDAFFKDWEDWMRSARKDLEGGKVVKE